MKNREPIVITCLVEIFSIKEKKILNQYDMMSLNNKNVNFGLILCIRIHGNKPFLLLRPSIFRHTL